jgi:flagellar biosynthesis protein FlhF
MVKETFVANDPREAFDLAKEKYGYFSELELLSAIQIKSPDGKLVSKITVSVPEDDFLRSIGIDEEEELASEIGDLKSKLEKMRELMNPTASNNELAKIEEIILGSGISKDWLDTTISSISDEELLTDSNLLFSYILEEIEAGIKVKPEVIDEKKTIMLIGSTGVGKTTTTAKLAARYSLLMKKNLKVALINLDTFRVGAFEQLGHYAKHMEIDHVRVKDVDIFLETLKGLSSYDVVIIDTAGISPYDTTKLIKTIEFLKSSQEYDIETSLVISATAKREDIEVVYDHFSFLDIDNVILTKFDETKRIGELVSFLLEHDIPISYISNGQSVPDDLIVADKDMIVDRYAGEIHV